MINVLPLLLWPRNTTLTTLIFHRVLPNIDPLRPGEPDAKRFDKLMSFVARHFTVLPLAEAARRLEDASLPHRACCITFDDGYSDNLTIALPILQRYRLPATVFVAVGYLDGGRMFNDQVIDAIALTTENLLDLREFDLGLYPLGSIADKLSAVTRILNRIKFSSPEFRDQQVDEIVRVAKCGPLPADVMLTSQQTRVMSDQGIEIGGHTVAHTILTTVDDTRAMEEIMDGKSRLESIIGKPVTSFAYPNGKFGRDYSDHHVPLVKGAGFLRAVTTEPGVGVLGGDLFQLPRYTPWGNSEFRIAAQLVRNVRTGATSAA